MSELREMPATPLFAGVENEDWPDLLGRSSRLDLNADDPVFRQGEEADAFFVVIAGAVEVRAGVKTSNMEIALARLGAGAVLGETSLFLGGEHSASVYASEPTTLLRFSTQAFTEMIETRHRGAIKVLYNIGLALSVRLRATDEQLTGSAFGATPIVGTATRSRKVYHAD